MANEAMKEMLHELLQDFEQQKQDMSTLQERLTSVMTQARSTGDLVTAWVNAQGVLIQLKFHPEAVERAGGLEALGRYVTEATQKAAQQAKAQLDEIMAPMKARMESLPHINEMFPGMPDPADFIPEPVSPSLAPPDSPERSVVNTADSGEHYEELSERRPRTSGPVNKAW